MVRQDCRAARGSNTRASDKPSISVAVAACPSRSSATLSASAALSTIARRAGIVESGRAGLSVGEGGGQKAREHR
jgi:hypothetical protein